MTPPARPAKSRWRWPRVWGAPAPGVLECTFEDEADVNLFGEQALWPLFNQAPAALLRGAGGGGSAPRTGRPGVLRLRRGRRDFPEDGGRGNVRANAPSLTHLPVRNAVTVPRAPRRRGQAAHEGYPEGHPQRGASPKSGAREQAGGYPNLKRLRRQAHTPSPESDREEHPTLDAALTPQVSAGAALLQKKGGMGLVWEGLCSAAL